MEETVMKTRLDLLRTIFLIIFILATLVVSGMALFLGANLSTDIPSEGVNPNVITIVGSAATSIIALLGFVVTTALSLRREKRETREFELALKQKELELERARLELEQIKKQLENKKE
jgi:hypothetical protein